MIDSRIHVIAEAGTNHNGSVTTGKKLIEVGRAAGANSVKFQMIFPAGLYLPKFYENGSYRDSEVFAQRAATALTPDQYRKLAADCRDSGVGFSCSVFDRRGIALLDELDAEYIKIASCDLNNSPLICAAAETGRRVVLSTGMSTLDEIEQAVRDVQATGNPNLVLMHCVSVYPAPTERMNLGFIDVLRHRFDMPLGLSDHTESSLAAAIAIGKGVTWIEKHFTLDRKSPGFDHAYAMETDSFTQFVHDCRSAEAGCAMQSDKLDPAEKNVRQRARRALYAARDIEAGETICDADVLIVRPEGPMSPNELPNAVGQIACRSIRQFQPLQLESFSRNSERMIDAAPVGSAR